MAGPSPRDDGTENRTLKLQGAPGDYSRIPMWIHRYKLGGGSYAVYCVLARYAGSERGIFPSMATIQKACYRSRSQVYEAVTTLEKLGLLSRKTRHGDDGRQTSNEYELAWATDPNPEPEPLWSDEGSGFPDASDIPDEGSDPSPETQYRGGVTETRTQLEERNEEEEEAHASSAPNRTAGHRDYVAALVDAVGGGRPLSDNRMGQIVKAAKQLRGMGADPSLVSSAWGEGLRRFDGRLTPIGLVDNWWALSGSANGTALLDRLQAIERQRSAK